MPRVERLAGASMPPLRWLLLLVHGARLSNSMDHRAAAASAVLWPRIKTGMWLNKTTAAGDGHAPVPLGSDTVARSCWSVYLGSMFSLACTYGQAQGGMAIDIMQRGA